MDNKILRQSHKSGSSFCHSVTFNGITSVYSISVPYAHNCHQTQPRSTTEFQCSKLMSIVDGILRDMGRTKEDVLTMNFRIVTMLGGGKHGQTSFCSNPTITQKRRDACEVMLENWISKDHRPAISVMDVPVIVFKSNAKIELDMTFRNLSDN